MNDERYANSESSNYGRWKNEHGVTLIELMSGIAVSVIVAAAAFTALTGSNKAAVVSDRTAQTQQNARIAMEFLSRDFKLAGFGMTGSVGACNAGIMPADNNTGGADTGPDRVSMVVPTTSSLAPMWTLAAQATGPFNTIQLQNGAVAAMTAAGLTANSAVSIGGAFSTGATASGNNLNLGTTVTAPMVFPANTQIFLLDCVTYQVIRPADANVVICGGNAPCLARGVDADLNCNTLPNTCVAIAEGIEDLQLAYGCDGCNGAVNGGVSNRIIDDQGAVNNTFEGTDFISNSTWTVAPMLPDTIRLVRVNVVARQTLNDQGLGEGQSSAVATLGPMIVEDHNPSSDAGYSVVAYQLVRRRLLTRTVEARNLELAL